MIRGFVGGTVPGGDVVILSSVIFPKCRAHVDRSCHCPCHNKAQQSKKHHSQRLNCCHSPTILIIFYADNEFNGNLGSLAIVHQFFCHQNEGRIRDYNRDGNCSMEIDAIITSGQD